MLVKNRNGRQEGFIHPLSNASNFAMLHSGNRHSFSSAPSESSMPYMNRKPVLVAAHLAFTAVFASGTAIAQSSAPQPDPTQLAAAGSTTSALPSKSELKAQRNQQKLEEKAADAQAKAARSAAQAKKAQDSALRQQQKAAQAAETAHPSAASAETPATPANPDTPKN
jgi:hypothetical protein